LEKQHQKDESGDGEPIPVIERRRHERKRIVISMQTAVAANAHNEWSKQEDRWQKIERWTDQFQPKKGKK
jgi:hypothetical protein